MSLDQFELEQRSPAASYLLLETDVLVIGGCPAENLSPDKIGDV